MQRLVRHQFIREGWSRPDSQGCQMVDVQLQLHGWSAKRRDDGNLLKVDLWPSVHESNRLSEHSVVLTDANHPNEAIAQLHRKRADGENGFDELNN